MAKKEKRKKKRGGGAIVGVGVLALAGLLAMDPFGLGFGLGGENGIPSSGDNISQAPEEGDSPSVTPEATEAPQETMPPTPTEGVGEVVLKEVSVEVNGKKILYNGSEAESAQRLAAQFVTEYVEELENLLVKVQLTDAVYDTVEELKLALESCGIKYEIVE